MNNQLRQVEQFMTAFGQHVASRPVTAINAATALLRINLILEEVSELSKSLGVTMNYQTRATPGHNNVNQVEALDALTDITYVVNGTYLTLGLQPVAEDAFDEVHRSNMAKRGPLGEVRRSEHGKILKPTDWTPPNLVHVLSSAFRQPNPFQPEFRRDILQTEEDSQVTLD